MPIGEEESIPLFLAEDCPLQEFREGLLLRKLPLKLEKPAAIPDPQRTPIARKWETIFG
jgi:hypothetical protein